jgi:hypothetical protein
MRRTLLAAVACLTLAVAAPLVWLVTRAPGDVGLRVEALPSPRPTVGATPAPARTPGRSVSRPVRIEIPSLDVDARIVPVGVSRDGSMVIPRLAREVGWYRYGPTPGEPAGHAVIAGHVDARSQGPGAFFRLRDIDVAAPITVTTRGGEELRYRVVGRQVHEKTRLPVERIFRRDGRPLLVLVSCGGEFDAELSSYRDNIVVIAEPE